MFWAAFRIAASEDLVLGGAAAAVVLREREREREKRREDGSVKMAEGGNKEESERG